MANLSKRSLDALQGVEPSLVQLIKSAIVDTPQDFTVVEGVRTTKRQQDLYAQGRTKTGKIVTNTDGVKNKSNHQVKADGYGYAVDLFPYFEGQVQVSHKDTVKKLKIITDHLKAKAKCMNITISCGIDWKFFDAPHVEIKK